MTARAGDATPSEAPIIIRKSLQGKYAGFASRFAAFAVDVGVSLGVFMLALAAISFAASVLTGKDITWNEGDTWVIVAYAVWAFGYFAYSWAASGRTAGAWRCSACGSCETMAPTRAGARRSCARSRSR